MVRLDINICGDRGYYYCTPDSKKMDVIYYFCRILMSGKSYWYNDNGNSLSCKTRKDYYRLVKLKVLW